VGFDFDWVVFIMPCKSLDRCNWKWSIDWKLGIICSDSVTVSVDVGKEPA